MTFEDYLSGNVLSELADSPRVYLIPSGSDVMTYSNSDPAVAWDSNNPSQNLRVWNVVDQKIRSRSPRPALSLIVSITTQSLTILMTVMGIHEDFPLSAPP